MTAPTAARPPREGHDPDSHRWEVLRRLMALGLSVRTLTALLPAWERQIRAAGDDLLRSAGPLAEDG